MRILVFDRASSPRRDETTMAKNATLAKSSDSEANSEKIKRDKKRDQKTSKGPAHHGVSGAAKGTSSKVVYDGRLFRVVQDRVGEPGGKESTRDVVRHNGSAVILAVDNSKSKNDPWIVME